MCMQSTSNFSSEVFGSYCLAGKDYLVSYKSFTVFWFPARNYDSSYCLQISPLLFFSGILHFSRLKISYSCSSISYDVCVYVCSFVFMTYWGEDQSTYFNHMKRHNNCDIVLCIAFFYLFQLTWKTNQKHIKQIFLPSFTVMAFWSI